MNLFTVLGLVGGIGCVVISIMTSGDASNNTAEGRAQNRRVDFVLMKADPT